MSTSSPPPGSERLRAQRAALAELTRGTVLQGADLQRSLHHVTETAARALQCGRVSLSRYTPARDAIRCIDLYELEADRHSTGFELPVAPYPRYFAALGSLDAIDADDAQADPRTAEFHASGYLRRHGVTAMLDVPLRLYGALEGVLCFEQVGTHVPWADEDRLFGIAVTNLIALAIEQHERQAAVQALRRSEQRFAAMIAQAPDAFVSIGDSGRVSEWNRQAEAAFGWRRDEVLGRDLAEVLVPPRYRRQHREGLRHFLAMGCSSSVLNSRIELSALHRDGHEIPVEISIAAMRSVDGCSFNAFLRDISERNAAQEALRQSEQRLATLIAYAPEAIVVLDADTLRFVEATESAARLFGRSREELLALGPLELSPERQPDGRVSREVAHEAVQRALDGEPVVFDWTHLDHDGRPFCCEVRVLRLPDPQRRLLRGSIVDISERVRIQAELREARDAAESASRAKSEFLAGMSHELRTPLNGVLGYAQLLRDQAGLNELQAKALGVIQSSAEHLLGLIDEILDTAKVEAGTLELRTEGFDLHALIEQVAVVMQRRAEGRGLSFTCECGAEVPMLVTGDGRRLRQVLTNLVDNAIKYTDAGGVTLRCKCNGVRLHFEVEDTGIGIASEHLRDIFEVFHQLHRPGRAAEGTGLGLAICRSLVALMGGQLSVHSTPGVGSRFWFEVELPVAGPLGAGLSRRPVIGVAGQGRRLLVVDDNASSRALLFDLLGPWGFELRQAADGAAGVAAALQWRPDLILMDLRMPGGGGLAATRRIRARPELAGVCIVVVSASAFVEDRAGCLEAGADDFLAKPFRHERLFELLAKHLGLPLVRAEAETAATGSAPPADVAQDVAAPRERLDELLGLARRGDARALSQRARQIEATHPQFAARLLALSEGFRMRQLRLWLESLKPESDDERAA